MRNNVQQLDGKRVGIGLYHFEEIVDKCVREFIVFHDAKFVHQFLTPHFNLW